MNQLQRAAGAAFALGLIISGCETEPSASRGLAQGEGSGDQTFGYIDHSTASPDAGLPGYAGHRPPPLEPASPERRTSRVIIIEPRERGAANDFDADDARLDMNPGPAGAEVLMESSLARNQLRSLQRELDELSARAQAKGIAASNALEEPQRDFRMTARMIDDRLDSYRWAAPSQRRSLELEIDLLLNDARQAVASAREQLEAAPAEGQAPE